MIQISLVYLSAKHVCAKTCKNSQIVFNITIQIAKKLYLNILSPATKVTDGRPEGLYVIYNIIASANIAIIYGPYTTLKCFRRLPCNNKV